MTPDGRALDDVEPQDMARGFGDLLESVADAVEQGSPTTDEARAEMVEMLRRGAIAARMWAEFGKHWPAPSRAPLSSLQKYRDEPTGLDGDDE